MLASEVITAVRLLLNDSIATYRWSDASLLVWISEAQRQVINRRPEAGLSSTGSVTISPATVTATTDTLTLGEDWKQPIVDWVAYRAFLEDQEGSGENTKKAAGHLQAFAAGVS